MQKIDQDKMNSGKTNSGEADLLQQTLIKTFSGFIANDRIHSSFVEKKPFECDGLSAYTEIPLLVVSVTSTAEVQQVLKTCHQLGVPVVPRGSGTGLSGGATPHANGVTLNMARMNDILELDPHNRVAVVQPGVRNIQVSEAVAPYQLFFAPDPSSQIACSIGGNVAENAGGLHCLKYGLTTNNILGAKVVLANGDIIHLGGKFASPQELNMLSAVIGSEGLLGIVTEITVKLIPKPKHEQVLLAGFSSISDAADCVGSIIAKGIIPAALEMMDHFTLNAVEKFTQSNLPIECAAVLLCEVDGSDLEIHEQMQTVLDLCKQHNASHLRLSQSDQERQKLWQGRKSAFPALALFQPDYYCLDGTIPRRHLSQVLEKIAQLSKQYGLQVANVFHAGDGNMHPLILFDSSKPGELEVCEELGGKILQACIDCGGTISGEHGIGIEKIDKMCDQFNSDELEQFFALKKAFDAKDIMNPGKNIPTLTRCAEVGGTHHRHADRKPHDHLEHF